MEVDELHLAGAKLLRPKVFHDARGFFLESYSEPRYRELGIDAHFVQDNHSRSGPGTLRGLHYQSSPGQAKLLRVVLGRIFDVIVDIRPDSATFGQSHGLYLDAEYHHQLFIPIGFAHGFCVMGEVAEILYKVSSPYDAATECAIRWDDPELGIEWPVVSPVLSARDETSQTFADFKAKLGQQR